jgi:SAM-dependent methyltransferase
MERDVLVDEFTHQAESFNRSAVMQSADTLGVLVDAMPLSPGERWIDVACGPGLIARGMAPLVHEVVGVDVTPAMVEVARREARAQGLTNAVFELGDATALDHPDACFDGAVTRFSLHHIPLPGRVVTEMARVVRPGGHVVIADHLTSDNADAAAFHQEIERLRDPSHWTCLTAARLVAVGTDAGLELVSAGRHPFSLDYAEWLARGSGGPQAERLIEQAFANRTDQPPEFRRNGDGTKLQLAYGLTIWRRV